MTGLDRAAAEAAVVAALAAARADGLAVSVAVVDERGADLVVVRDDGAAWFTPGVARAKAATSAAMRAPTAALGELRAAYPELADLVDDQLPHRFTTLPGGVPLVLGGRHVGAVAVSGAHPDQDVACAEAAARALAWRPRSPAHPGAIDTCCRGVCRRSSANSTRTPGLLCIDHYSESHHK
ncbi:GlcG/HbpS family heme-binding protein [Nocardioides abyssi]|uniref:Heme-binding protein n=1 Tax=Nocardioides abyssi TaxID=3058370 RepID=A0ABT8EUH9_9ACTN|nr:heme-binding protein [Nocardioides abyssi]MDN4161764.1 heme-binding protein [Nocardioides abyssi]